MGEEKLILKINRIIIHFLFSTGWRSLNELFLIDSALLCPLSVTELLHTFRNSRKIVSVIDFFLTTQHCDILARLNQVIILVSVGKSNICDSCAKCKQLCLLVRRWCSATEFQTMSTCWLNTNNLNISAVHNRHKTTERINNICIEFWCKCFWMSIFGSIDKLWSGF